MKYAIILMDGAADEPLDELEGQTILEAAHIPHTDWISTHGRQGLVHNVPDGFSPGSDVALMSVLGYNPNQYYTGRAPLEAAAQEIQTGPGDLIFRCNLVTVADSVMLDYSAGHIGTEEAAHLIDTLNDELGNDHLTFYSGVGYRHLMVWRDFSYDGQTVPPHDIMDQPLSKHLPRGRTGKKLVELMDRAADILGQHDINKVRSDLGENVANRIWLWGQGRRPQMDRFQNRFKINGSVITAVDLVRGLGRLMGMQIIEVEGATGYLDTDYGAKGRAALESLRERDLVFVHVESPDEAGHNAMVEEKIKAVEEIDKHIVGPVLTQLQGLPEDQWRIMVLPDHPTPIRLRTHTSDPVPFALAGNGVTCNLPKSYSENHARESGFLIENGHDLMEYFLRGKG